MIRKYIRLSLSVLALGVSCYAEDVGHPAIQWSEQTIELRSNGVVRFLRPKWIMKNIGNEDVVIRTVHPDCPCISGQDKYAGLRVRPNETAVIELTFDSQHEYGRVRRSIHLTAEIGSRALAETIRMEASLPDLIHIQPIGLTWGADEGLITKRVEIVAHPDITAISLGNLDAVASDFRVSLTPDPANPAHWSLIVQPLRHIPGKVTAVRLIGARQGGGPSHSVDVFLAQRAEPPNTDSPAE